MFGPFPTLFSTFFEVLNQKVRTFFDDIDNAILYGKYVGGFQFLESTVENSLVVSSSASIRINVVQISYTYRNIENITKLNTNPQNKSQTITNIYSHEIILMGAKPNKWMRLTVEMTVEIRSHQKYITLVFHTVRMIFAN